MKLKKTTAALFVFGLTVAGSSYAWANEGILKSNEEQLPMASEESTNTLIESASTIDPSEYAEETSNTTSTVTLEETTEDETKDELSEVSNKETNVESTEETDAKENEFPDIPEGYTAGNLVALKQAYENAGSDNAKQAILRNAQKAIAKFKAKQDSKEVEKTDEITVELELVGKINPGDTSIDPVEKQTNKTINQQTVIQTTETLDQKENETSAKNQEKVEKKVLKEQQKSEKKAQKNEQKAEKKLGKE